jgi:hypothetical protein
MKFSFIKDPQDICVHLNLCNETLLTQIQPIKISSTDDVMSVSIDIQLFKCFISLIVNKRYSQLYFMQIGV